ncbi:MAG: LPP20 family lipoprotein [Negativicutes bacterium]
MKKSLVILLTLLLVVSSGAFCLADTTVSSTSGLQGDTIQADGYGVAKPSINPAQASILAQRAAKADAYRNLVEQIQGVQIDATTTVQDAMVTNDTIVTKVNGFVRGAKVVLSEPIAGGGWHIVLSIPLYGANGLAPLVADTIRANEPAAEAYAPVTSDNIPQANLTPVPATTLPAISVPAVSQGPATGLILDCRGTSAERTMAPVIYNESGQVIYSSRNIAYDVLINSGLCDYVVKSSTDYSRAGNTPLMIRPIALRDFNRNFVVSNADGARILAADAQGGMLAKAAMVVLVN